MKRLGGEVIMLQSADLQLGRGETVADTARVLSRYVACNMMRTFEHRPLLEMDGHATVPVLNGLPDRTHPCQLLTDVMAIEATRGQIKERGEEWMGGGAN